jgi:hypothetical protein
VQQRRLAGPVAAHDGDHLAGVQVEVHVAQGKDVAEAHGQPAHAGHDLTPGGRDAPLPAPG